MKSKGILFSTAMVRAILDDRKGMTRRLAKSTDKWVKSFDFPRPPYQPGDILYVKETWYYESHMEDTETDKPDLPGGLYSRRIVYRASSPDYPVNVGVGRQGWRPSIFMPRSAARIWLRVSAVRCERLQEITPHDAWLEGCRIGNSFPWEDHIPELQEMCITHLFKPLWDSINKKHPWSANDWVWAITFERIEKQEGV